MVILMGKGPTEAKYGLIGWKGGCMWASRAPFIDRADNLDGALTAFKIQKAVNAKNVADN